MLVNSANSIVIGDGSATIISNSVMPSLLPPTSKPTPDMEEYHAIIPTCQQTISGRHEVDCINGCRPDSVQRSRQYVKLPVEPTVVVCKSVVCAPVIML